MATQVSGATFAFGGATFTAPAAGSYRIGEFREAPRPSAASSRLSPAPVAT